MVHLCINCARQWMTVNDRQTCHWKGRLLEGEILGFFETYHDYFIWPWKRCLIAHDKKNRPFRCGEEESSNFLDHNSNDSKIVQRKRIISYYSKNTKGSPKSPKSMKVHQLLDSRAICLQNDASDSYFTCNMLEAFRPLSDFSVVNKPKGMKKNCENQNSA